MATRFVSDRPLRVSSQVMGRPLGSPTRRLLAAAFDGVPLFALMASLAVGAAALSLRVSDPAGFAALRTLLANSGPPEALHSARRDAARLLVRIEARGLPPAVALAVEEGRLDDAANALAGHDLSWNLNLGESEPLVIGGHERAIPPVRVPVEKLIPGGIRIVVILGVPALYFTLLTSLWGATLGKRLLGLRVVRLDGERLSPLESFERFTGYLHIPALLGWPVLDLWRNPNRQLPHDRTVHTVVVLSARRGLKAAAPAPEPVELSPAAPPSPSEPKA